MGKQRWQFETGFKQQIVQEVESGRLSASVASRKYEISASVIDHWRRQAGQGGLDSAPSAREKLLERENRELKERLAELYVEVDHLKKLGDWLRRHKSVSTSVITAESLARLPKGSKLDCATRVLYFHLLPYASSFTELITTASTGTS